ncbi:MAG: CAP domain-containing protein [bacterium]|nr:CAP domain-containing protein [bacterium]
MSFLRTVVHLFHPQRSNNHRARILHPHSLFQLSAIAIFFAVSLQLIRSTQTPLGLVLGYATSISADQVIELTNEARSQNGLTPLTLNPALSQAALAKAQHMFTEQYWAHVSPSGQEPWDFIRNAGYSYTVAGENLARDFMQSEDMVAGWMASPTHRANIVGTEYEEIGIAVVNGELKGTETTLVVQLFGKPKSTVGQVGLIPPVSADESVGPTGAKIVVTTTHATQQSKLSPLDLTKAVFVSLLVILLAALVYDTVIVTKKRIVRSVGKNFGHIMLYLVVAALILFFKGGVIG